jgi:hypothetical protein
MNGSRRAAKNPSLSRYEDEVVRGAWSGDGRRAVNAAVNDTSRLWDATSDQELLSGAATKEFVAGPAGLRRSGAAVRPRNGYAGLSHDVGPVRQRHDTYRARRRSRGAARQLMAPHARAFASFSLFRPDSPRRSRLPAAMHSASSNGRRQPRPPCCGRLAASPPFAWLAFRCTLGHRLQTAFAVDLPMPHRPSDDGRGDVQFRRRRAARRRSGAAERFARVTITHGRARRAPDRRGRPVPQPASLAVSVIASLAGRPRCS